MLDDLVTIGGGDGDCCTFACHAWPPGRSRQPGLDQARPLIRISGVFPDARAEDENNDDDGDSLQAFTKIRRDGPMTKDERFEAIYRKHYARVWRYFRAQRIADDEAHDLAQDVFKRFYEYFDQFRGDDGAVWSFLETIVLTVFRNRIRAGKTAKRNGLTIDIDDPELEFDPPAPEGPDYATREEAARRRQQLREAVAELPPSQRDCVRLWGEGFTYDEIAERLRITVDAVKSRLRDAKKTLRKRLGDKS